MKIIRFDMTGDLGRSTYDHFDRASLTRKETHAAFALTCKQVKERNAITWQDTLLQT
jgi:hypothetical protein